MPARDEIKQVLTAEDRNYSRTMRKAKGSLNDFLGEGRKTSGVMMGAAKAMSGFGVAVAGLSLVKLTSDLVAFGVASLHATDALAKGAEKLGTTAQRLAEYRFEAGQAGVETNVLEKSLATMQKRIAEAAQGTGEAVKQLKAMGLSAKELNKLSMDEQFDILAQKVNEATNQGEKFLILQKLMDSGGRDLVKMMDDLNITTGATKERMEELGYVMSEETAVAAEEFQDRTGELDLAWAGFGVTIGSLIAGPFASLKTTLAELIGSTSKLIDSMRSIEKQRFSGSIDEQIGALNEMNAQLYRENKNLEEGGMYWNQNTRQIAANVRTRAQLQARLETLGTAAEETAEALGGGGGAAAAAAAGGGGGVAGGAGRAAKAMKTAEQSAQELLDTLEKQNIILDGGKEAWTDYQIATLEAAGASEEIIAKLRSANEEIKAHSEETVGAAKAVKVEITDLAKIGLEGFGRLDDAAQQTWYNIFSGAQDSMQSIKDLILQTLAELAHHFTTKQLIIPLVASLSGEAGAASTAGQALGGGGGGLFGGNPLMSAGKTLFQGASSYLGGLSIAAGTAGSGAALGMGAGVSGGLAAAHAGGGAAAIGAGMTGAAAGAGSAAIAAIGTAMPYIGAAIAIGSMFGLFGGEKETFPQFAIGGKIGDARALSKDVENIENIQKFADGLDEMVTDVLGQSVVDAINDAAGDQQSMTHRLRHDYELQDAMRHRLALYFYHLDGAMGDALLNMPKTESPEALAAQVQEFLKPFGEAMFALDMLTRQGIGGLEPGIGTAKAAASLTMKSGGQFGTGMMAMFEDYFTETEMLSAAYAQAYENVVELNHELELSGTGIMDTKEELRAFIETLDLSTESGQDAALTALDLASNVTTLETALAGIMGEIDAEIMSLAYLSANMGDIFAGTRQTLEEFGLEGTKLYSHLREQIDSVAAGIGQLDTAADIEGAMQDINSLMTRAMGALSEAELGNLIDPLKTYIDDLEAHARKRIGELEVRAAEEKESIAATLAEGANRMLAAADQGTTAANINMQAANALMRAAQAIPTNITVTLRENELSG